MIAGLLAAAALAWQGAEVPRLASASAQLEHARKVRSEARGLEGAARLEALERALRAYEAVRDFWPDSGAIAAEAAFRRGEIHRSLGQDGAARGAFQEAFDAGRGTDYAPRALLEVGHIHRRAVEMDQALHYYERALALEGASLRRRNDAREWIGRVRLDLQQWEAAAAAFASWAAEAEGPVEAVRAADLEAQAWIGKGELDRAAERLAALEQRVKPLAAEPTREAEELRRALGRMKAPDLLRAARERCAAEGSPSARSPPPP